MYLLLHYRQIEINAFQNYSNIFYEPKFDRIHLMK